MCSACVGGFEVHTWLSGIKSTSALSMSSKFTAPTQPLFGQKGNKSYVHYS